MELPADKSSDSSFLLPKHPSTYLGQLDDFDDFSSGPNLELEIYKDDLVGDVRLRHPESP